MAARHTDDYNMAMPSARSFATRRRAWLFAPIVLTGVLSVLVSPAAHAVDDPGAQRQSIRQQQADVASRLDTLRASDAEVTAALAVLNRNVAEQQARAADTQRAFEAATGALQAANQRVDSIQASLNAYDSQLREMAVDSYIRPPGNDLGDVIIRGSLVDAPVRQALARSRVHTLGDLLDHYRAIHQDLDRARDVAESARRQAEQANNAEQAHLADLQAATTAQQSFADQVRDRIDRALGEAANLASRDSALASQIQRQQSSLAVQVGSGSGRSSGRSGGSVSTAVVGGIEVSVEIARPLAALLQAAAGAGIYLSGSGYRDINEQIQLRREYCGSSDYAIWEMPSTDCSPPVARPGRSMHEQGLAIDFVAGGDLIRSHSSAAFQWLAENAARFGFYNLPSEPWHWSTTGS